MNDCWADQRDRCTKPYVFSFITLRQERFGGLLFNPYIGLETNLDPIEAYIAAMCNGQNTCQQVEEAVQQRFGLSFQNTERCLAVTTDKLMRSSALAFRDGRRADRPSLPDAPVFAADGPYLSAPKTVIWDVTYACNLHCAHCLTSSGRAWANELTTQQALSLVDMLADAKVLYLSLSGGEPFLRHDVLTLLQHIAKTNMRVEIVTNGVLIPDSVWEALPELPIFQIQVSIDGIDEQHDQFRGRPGAFDATCLTVERLRAHEIAVSASTTVTAANVGDLDQIIDLALALGCRGFKAIPFMAAGRGRENSSRLRLNSDQRRLFAQTMVRRHKELQGRMNVLAETCFAFLLEPPPATAYANGPMGCAAGYDTLSVGADGTAYPCPFLHDFPLGNLMEHSLEALWFQAPVLRTLRTLQKQDLGEPCNSCPYAPLKCRGGCRAAAFLESGDLYAGDTTCFGATQVLSIES